MRSFLGVPILIRGEAWGNLYLTEKVGGEPFALDDEEAVIVLADWAAIAIENARLYRDVAVRSEELERAVRGLRATAAIARAIGGETELERILELVVKRGRALIEAHDVLIMLREGDELVIAAGAGHVQIANTARLPLAGSTAARCGRRPPPTHRRRGPRAPVPPDQLGLDHASTALLVPLLYRGQRLGVLAPSTASTATAPSRVTTSSSGGLAAQAATAVATAKSVEADRRRRSLAATEAERHRWARAARRERCRRRRPEDPPVSATRLDDPESMRVAMREATEQLTGDIESLRALIAELRPPASTSSAWRPRSRPSQRTGAGNDARSAPSHASDDRRLAPEPRRPSIASSRSRSPTSSSTPAPSVDIAVRCADDAVDVSVADDGIGFDAEARRGNGFGLAGMRERVELAGGELSVLPGGDAGTVVRARLPLAEPTYPALTNPWSSA
jgi:GAF domain-containing protein